MRVKQKSCCQNEKRAVPPGFHFEKTPKQPANEQHIERAVATLPDVEQELNRKDEQRGRRESDQPTSEQSPEKKIDDEDRHPSCDRERKTRGERVLSEKEEGTSGQVILDPRMRHHHQVAVEARAVIGIQKCATVPRFRDAEFEDVRSQCGGIPLIFPQII